MKHAGSLANEFLAAHPYPAQTRRPRRRVKVTHAEIVADVPTKLARWKRQGASEWLLEEERRAQSQGFTLVRQMGHWYRVPLESNEQHKARLLAERGQAQGTTSAEDRATFFQYLDD